jgi:hypothetical protein
MRKCVGVLMVCAILLSIGSTAQATKTWVSGNAGSWSTAANWGGTVPSSAETAVISNTGAGGAVLDTTQTIGQLLMGYAATDVGVLNINTGATLNVSKASAELVCLVKGAVSAGGTMTVNHSSGTVNVFSTGYAGTGEIRLVTANTSTGTAVYNLSGTAVLDTEVLSKGNKTNTSAQFNATGGTLVLRNMIYRFGKASEGAGFNQGTAKLEVGAINTVAALSVGNSTNVMDYTCGTGGTINIDIASATSYDKVSQWVDNTSAGICYANLNGATFSIDLGYAPAPMSFFDVWTFNATGITTPGKLSGSGTVNVPTGWTAGWIDTNADAVTDTLRLTYIPEPATIALLGLGLLAIRRNKK